VDEALCPICGAPAPALAGAGLMLFGSDTDVPFLIQLFEKEFDTAKCEAGHKLDIRPTVVVAFRDPNITYVSLGSLAEAQRATILGQEEQYRSAGIALKVLPSLNELRSAVAKRLIARVRALEPLFEARAQGTLVAYVHTHWRTLTPQVFAALRVGLSGVVPGLLIGVQGPDETRPSNQKELLAWFANTQSVVWLGLCMSWFPDGSHSPTLEEDLRRFVDGSPVIEGALEDLFATFDRFAASTLTFTSHFCIEAVRASLCANQDRPNPQARLWTELFFEHELALRLEDDAIDPELKAMTISDKRARATIGFQQARDTVARRMANLLNAPDDTSSRLERIDAIGEVATKAGYADLLDTVSAGLNLNVPVENLADLLIDKLRNPPSQEDQTEFVRLTQILARSLAKHGRVDDLERLADAMIDALGGTNEARAAIDAWVGARLKDMRLPLRFLRRVGLEPQTWEYNLPVRLRADLLMERSNALRILGRPADALELVEEVITLLSDNVGADVPHSDQWHVAQRNRAILLRETGSPDAALELLENLLAETAPQDQLGILESLATTYTFAGRQDEAIRCYDRAIELAVGVQADRAASLQAARAQVLATISRAPEIPEMLTSADLDPRADPIAALTQAGMWINILANSGEVPSSARGRLARLYSAMPALIEDAEERGDAWVHLNALINLALMSEHIGQREGAETIWLEAVRVALDVYGQIPEPISLLKLARYAFERGNLESGRAHLSSVSRALAEDLGGVRDLKSVFNSAALIENALDEVTNTILFDPESKATWEDIRLASELRRDTISRARTLRRQDQERADNVELPKGLPDEVVAQLAPANGRVAILECIETDEIIAFFITCIHADGKVASHWLELPETEMDFTRLAVRMRTKLNNWTPNRPGDPFDIAEWQAFETWVEQSLEPYLEDGDHIVFIERKDYLGIPWHVAAAPRWTSSYAASWTNLLAFHEQAPVRNRHGTVGVVLVPRFGDPPEVVDALRNSAQQAQSLATSSGLRCLVAVEHACDRDAFLRIVSDTDITMVLCHGFVDPADGEIALMLAHDGRLPLGESVASSSPVGRFHRMSWRECQQLTSAPRVVFSAACRSGVTQIAGVGEQLGLFSALRHAGSSTLVAPRWDIVAVEVLPVLDEVFARYLQGSGKSLAQVLREVCRAAEVESPRWLAWSVAIEGDWR
jgi:tetratricopeptide (TPR) repeat protein